MTEDDVNPLGPAETAPGAPDPVVVKATEPHPRASDDDAKIIAALKDAAPQGPVSGGRDADAILAALQDAKGAGDGSRPQTPPKPGRMTKGELAKLPYAQKVAWQEARNNPTIGAKTSSAVGLGQFLASGQNGQPAPFVTLVRKYRPDLAKGKSDAQILAMRTDPNLSLQMIDASGNENAQVLKQNNVPVNDATKYGAHWFGAQGFTNLYSASPWTPMEQIIGERAARANGLVGKQAGEIRNLIAEKMGLDGMPDNYGFPQAAQEAIYNTPGSLGHAAAGIYESVRHPRQTFDALKGIAIGLDSKIRGYAGEEQNPAQKAKDEALVDALAHSYAEKYGNLEDFSNYLQHDPAGVALDLSTVLTGGEGAALTAGKGIAKAGEVGAKAGELLSGLGSVTRPVGDVLQGAGRGVQRFGEGTQTAGRLMGKAAEATNPLDPFGIVSGALGGNPKPISLVSKSGTVVPELDQLARNVSGGMLDASDLARAPGAEQISATLGEKGVSDAAMREGILKSVDPGMKAPTSTVTGRRPPDLAREAVQEATAENNNILARRATELAGAEAPSASNVADALEQAYVASANKAEAMYDAIRGVKGSFGTTLDHPGFLTRAEAELKAAGIPSTPALLAAKSSMYPRATEAMQAIEDLFQNGKTALKPGGDIDAPEVLHLRKELNDLRFKADGPDEEAVRRIIDAYHDHLAASSKPGMFADAAGKPVSVGDQINAANAYYRGHMATFQTPNGLNNPIVNAVKTLRKSLPRDASGLLQPSGDAAVHAAVQAPLVKQLLDPATGENVYNQLVHIMGGPKSAGSEAVNDFVKQTLLHNNGVALTPGKEAERLMTARHPLVDRAFGSPQAASEARRLHAAHYINNAKLGPKLEKHRLISSLFGKTVRHVAMGALGYHFGHFPGMIAGELLEQPVEHMLKARKMASAMKGAPGKTGIHHAAAKAVRKAVSRPSALVSHALQAIEAPNQPVAEGRVGRASGGRVDDQKVEQLATRLMNRAKDVRRVTKASTEPLLKTPDDAVAKALAVAQRAI